MSEVQLKVIDLYKHYGEVRAVDGVSFEVRAGEITCLAGPNGSGKTTTVEIIEGLRVADTGRVFVLGRELHYRDSRPDKLGVQLQEESLPARIKVSEAIEFYTRVYRPSRPPEHLVDMLGLRQFWRSTFATLSGGQKRRTQLALAMLNEPSALVLDEPTSGLDPEVSEMIVQLLQDLRSEGVAILITMHDLGQAESLADNVVLLHHGRVVKHGSPRHLIDGLGATHRVSVPIEAANSTGEPTVESAITIGRRRILYGGSNLADWYGSLPAESATPFEFRSVGLVDVYLLELNERDVGRAAVDLREATS